MAEAAPVIKTHCWVPSRAMTRSSQSTIFPYDVFSKNVFSFRLNIFSWISLTPSLPKSRVDLWTSLRWPKSLFGENFIVEQYTNGSLWGFVKSKCIGIVLAPPSSPLPLHEKKKQTSLRVFFSLYFLFLKCRLRSWHLHASTLSASFEGMSELRVVSIILISHAENSS